MRTFIIQPHKEGETTKELLGREGEKSSWLPLEARENALSFSFKDVEVSTPSCIIFRHQRKYLKFNKKDIIELKG